MAPAQGTVLYAMGTMEGFFATDPKPNRPQKNCNPLDLSWSPEAKEFGATGGDPRFAIFPDADTGWAAARRWLSVPAKFGTGGSLVGGYLGATIEQVINRFAPPNENATDSYVAFVCSKAGCKPTDVLTAELLG